MSVAESAGPAWRRSSRCTTTGTCVEVAALPSAVATIAARDTKRGEQSPIVAFNGGEWRTLLSGIKDGAYDL